MWHRAEMWLPLLCFGSPLLESALECPQTIGIVHMMGFSVLGTCWLLYFYFLVCWFCSLHNRMVSWTTVSVLQTRKQAYLTVVLTETQTSACESASQLLCCDTEPRSGKNQEEAFSCAPLMGPISNKAVEGFVYTMGAHGRVLVLSKDALLAEEVRQVGLSPLLDLLSSLEPSKANRGRENYPLTKPRNSWRRSHLSS